mgnify:CR=1 FL=1
MTFCLDNPSLVILVIVRYASCLCHSNKKILLFTRVVANGFVTAVFTPISKATAIQSSLSVVFSAGRYVKVKKNLGSNCILELIQKIPLHLQCWDHFISLKMSTSTHFVIGSKELR